jgi:hypothetical protein
MTLFRSTLQIATSFALAALGARSVTEVHAQAVSVDVAFDQSFTSLDPLPSPTGLTLTAGAIRLWGPLGVQATFRSVSEPGGVVDQRCGFESCVPGPFEQAYVMRTAGIGLSYDFVNPVDVWLTLVLSGTANWQVERLQHLESGERTTLDSGGADLGVAAAAHLRLWPLLFGLRPEITLHYDRVFPSECMLDAACWPARDVFGISAGFGWVFNRAPVS